MDTGIQIKELAERAQLTGEEELAFQLGDANGKVKASCFKGAKGDNGDAGKLFTASDITAEQHDALKGERGDVGDPGPTGDAGPKGADGDKGKKGLPGANGQNGLPGANGSNGTDGKSAYQLAQEKGYAGSEEQFTELLNGYKQTYRDINLLMNSTSANYFVAAYDEEQLDPTPKFTKGNKDFLADWDFVLLDTTDNAGLTTTPVGVLKRNNLLRFRDGSFAPTVGITAAQRAECDVALYRRSSEGALTLYSEAGQFNAENFYNEYGMEKLYNSEGAEVRVLRPWETTETKYTIGLAYLKGDLYLLDQVKGKSGNVWKGIFTTPVTWDGIDVSQWKLVPTAIGPCPCCTIGGKARSFFYLYGGENGSRSSNGPGSMITLFNNGRTYPNYKNLTKNGCADKTRGNNANSDLPYPFAEGGYHAINTFITCMELLYETKYLHDANVFGSGISSNDECTNERTFLSNGGIRYKLVDGTDWYYKRFNGNGRPIDQTHFINSLGYVINANNPCEQCMESQMATSFAVETSVGENTDFDFYGGSYRYKNVAQAGGVANGLNVQLFKLMRQNVNSKDSEGNSTVWEFEINLRMSLVNGMKLMGDVFVRYDGGCEIVGTCEYPNNDSTGNPIQIYIEPNQRNWVYETDSEKANYGTFPFENMYPKVNELTNLKGGFTLERVSYSPYKAKNGGSISTGECAGISTQNGWSTSLHSRKRIALFIGGYKQDDSCSARCNNLSRDILNLYNAPSMQAIINTNNL